LEKKGWMLVNRGKYLWFALKKGQLMWFAGPRPVDKLSEKNAKGHLMVADCAVFPSVYEPFGIVALEAMAAGTPVVVSDVGGLSEVVEMHETGIKVHPSDPGSLAWGILHTLKNPEWSRTRAANAKRVARTEYNWARIARMTLDVYEQIAQEARAGDWAYKV